MSDGNARLVQQSNHFRVGDFVMPVLAREKLSEPQE